MKRTMADKQDELESNMSADELKLMTAADRRIALTKLLGDAWEMLLPKPVGEGGFDLEACFRGVCATMTADGMPPGHVPTFQSLKAHLKKNPEYVFTWDEPVIEPEDVDSDSEDEILLEDIDDEDDADDPNDPEEIDEDAGEGEQDDSYDTDPEFDTEPMYTVEEMLELPLPESITSKWIPIAEVEEACTALTTNSSIAHVFDIGWALGKLKKKVGNIYRVRYADGIWEHELQKDMYGKHWYLMKRR